MRRDPVLVVAQARIARADAGVLEPIAHHALPIIRTSVEQDLTALLDAGYVLKHVDDLQTMTLELARLRRQLADREAQAA